MSEIASREYYNIYWYIYISGDICTQALVTLYYIRIDRQRKMLMKSIGQKKKKN